MASVRPEETIFARNRSVDFSMFDREFQRYLRALVFFVQERGGTPFLHTGKYQGLDIGLWFDRVCKNPHELSEGERTALRSIPGVYLTATPPHRGRDVVMDSDRAALWRRLQVWAKDPLQDTVTRRRVEAMQRLKRQQVSADEAVDASSAQKG